MITKPTQQFSFYRCYRLAICDQHHVVGNERCIVMAYCVMMIMTGNIHYNSYIGHLAAEVNIESTVDLIKCFKRSARFSKLSLPSIDMGGSNCGGI